MKHHGEHNEGNRGKSKGENNEVYEEENTEGYDESLHAFFHGNSDGETNEKHQEENSEGNDVNHNAFFRENP